MYYTLLNKAIRYLRQSALRSLLLFSAMAGACSSALATELDDIISRGSIKIGVLADFPPFSFTDKNQKLTGYDPEVARLIGKKLGVEVTLVPISGPNRVPYLLSGKVDVLVSLLGVTLERATQVAYSSPYGSSKVMLLAPKKLKIKSAADLVGKVVAVPRSSSAEEMLKAVAPKGVEIRAFDSDAAAVQAVIVGQANATVSGVEMLRAINQANPSLDAEGAFTLRYQLNSMAVKRSDTDFLRWLNTFILLEKTNGELDALHRQWIGVPLDTLPSL